MRLGGSAAMDPNTHTFVVSTAFFVSLTFTVFALRLIALFLQHIYS
jgi:hypothetical protein